MFKEFTDRARKIMVLANREASRRKHEYIGPEHILLGLMIVEDGVGATALKNLGANLTELRTAIESVLRSGHKEVFGDNRPRTSRAQRVIGYAAEEARNLGDAHVGTEHLLLGLVRETNVDYVIVLESFQLSPEKIRREVMRLLGKTA